MSKQYLQNVPGLIYTNEEVPLAPPEQQQALVQKSLLEMPSATARGLLKIPGYVADIPALGMHYLSTGLSSMLPQEANQALGINTFQKSMLEPVGGAEFIGKQLDKAPTFFPKPETTVGQATEFLAEISPIAIEAIPGAVARRFGTEAVPYLAKKISDIQAGLVKPDELSGIEQLLLADPRLTSSIVSGYSTGPSSVFGKRKPGEVIDDASQTFVSENRSPLKVEDSGQVGANFPINPELEAEQQNPVFTSLLQNDKKSLLQNAPNKPQPAQDWLKTDEKGELKEGILGRLAKSAKNADGEMITTPSELKDIGLLDFIQSKEGQLITKQDIENYIDDYFDGLEITEVAYGDKPAFKVFDEQGNEVTAQTHSNYEDWFEDNRDDVMESVEQHFVYNNYTPEWQITTRNISNLDIDETDVEFDLEYEGNVDFDDTDEVEDFMDGLMSINGVDADEALSIAKDGGTLTINTKDTDLLALEDLGFNEIERRSNWEDEAFSELSDQGLNDEEINRVLYEDADYNILINSDGDIDDASIDVGDLDEQFYELNMQQWHELDEADRQELLEDLGYDPEEWAGDADAEVVEGQRVEITEQEGEYDPLFTLPYENAPKGGGITRQSKWGPYTVGNSNINYRELVFSLGEKSVNPDFRRTALELARKYDVATHHPDILATFKPNLEKGDLGKLPEEITNNWTPEEADNWKELTGYTNDMLTKMRGQNLAHAFSGEPLTHFQPVWMRFSDRLDQNGNRVLFLEEVQSDWFQAMHSKGERFTVNGVEFVQGEIADYKDAIKDYDEFIDIYRKYNFPDGPPRLRFQVKDSSGTVQNEFEDVQQIGPLPSDATIVDLYESPLSNPGGNLGFQANFADLYTQELDPDQMNKISAIKSNTSANDDAGLRNAYNDLKDQIVYRRDSMRDPNAQADLERLGELVQNIESKARRTKNIGPTISSAPYGNPLGNRDRWIRMAMKRALRWGADNGYDRVGFASAKDIMRVNHVRPVQKIEYMINADGQFSIGEDAIQITVTDENGDKLTHEYDPYSLHMYDSRPNALAGTLRANYLADMIDPNTAKMLKKEFDKLKKESQKMNEDEYLIEMNKLEGFDPFTSRGVLETNASKAYTYGSGRSGDIYKHIYDRVLPQYVKKLSKKLKVDSGVTRINKDDLMFRKHSVTEKEALDKGITQDRKVSDVLKIPKKSDRQEIVDYYDFNDVYSEAYSTGATYIDITDSKARNFIRKGMSLLD